MAAGFHTGVVCFSQSQRQRNIKQKFVALLKKFKVTESGDMNDEETSIMMNQRIDDGSVDAAEIEDLFNQLDSDLSDSGSNVGDNISIGSTPKPSLKPFFCSSKNLLQEGKKNKHAILLQTTI